MEAVIAVLLIAGFLSMILGIILLVYTLGYLRAGRAAFERYLDMTDDPVGKPGPVPPTASGGTHRRTRSGTSWGQQ